MEEGDAATASVVIGAMADGICNAPDPMGLTVLITDSTQGMTQSWETVAGDLGYSYSVVPLNHLESTAFYGTADVLVVSSGTDVYNTAIASNVQGFIESVGLSIFSLNMIAVTHPINTLKKW